MDMKISGSGNVPAGEYEKVRISGSGRLHGLVRCESFHTSGASKGEQLDCKNELHVSGSSKFDGSITTGSVSVSGSFACGDIAVTDTLGCSGGMKSTGSIKCARLSVSGGISAAGDIEAETVKVSGSLNCGGLLNAEEITIKFSSGMEIGDIGGSRIAIYKDSSAKPVIRLPLISSLLKGAGSTVRVKNSIEGDSIALEYVTAERVSGRIVAIGAGCEIGLVQYSDEVEISPDAKVERTEKI